MDVVRETRSAERQLPQVVPVRLPEQAQCLPLPFIGLTTRFCWSRQCFFGHMSRTCCPHLDKEYLFLPRLPYK